MNLNFNILWYDNNHDYYDSIKHEIETLRNKINSWGFSSTINFVLDSNAFMGNSPFKNFDLIVVDKNLEDTHDGKDFIKQIRENTVYTEIIFYTSGDVGKIWEDIKDLTLEGIFVSHRTNIIEKIEKIGFQSIRKILDLDNMRGIVMAEVGELDHILDNLIQVEFNNLDESKQTSIYNKFHKRYLTRQKNNIKLITNFIERPDISEMLSLCESETRWNILKSLAKNNRKITISQLGDYSTEILNPRNFLAHGKPEIIDEENYVFYYRGKSFDYNEDISKDLRTRILEFKDGFSNILKTLQSSTLPDSTVEIQK